MCNFKSGYVIRRGILISLVTDSHNEIVLEHKESMWLTDKEVEEGVPVELKLKDGGCYDNHDDFEFVIDCLASKIPSWFDAKKVEAEFRGILKEILPPMAEIKVFPGDLDLHNYSHDFNAPLLTQTGDLDLHNYSHDFNAPLLTQTGDLYLRNYSHDFNAPLLIQTGYLYLRNYSHDFNAPLLTQTGHLDLQGYSHDFNAPLLTQTGDLYLQGYSHAQELRALIDANKRKSQID